LPTTERVSCSKLRTGMFVSELDRPWVETPFLFQGFEIRTHREISELRRYCDYVYVDAEASQPASLSPDASEPDPDLPDPGSVTRRGERGRLRGLKRLLSVFSRSRDSKRAENGALYQDQHTIKEELPLARDIHKQSLDSVSATMTRLREGGSLSVELIDDVMDPMIDSVLRNHEALALLTRMAKTDDYLCSHSVGCAVYAIAFGRHLGLDREQLHILGTGALLLDVGKTRLSPDLLINEDQLSEAEAEVLRSHVELGVGILTETPGLAPVIIEIVRTHHERFDGRGYPQGLAGADIPVYGRIAGIVDHYDAMTARQRGGAALSPFDAMREIHKAVNVEFQAEMVERFVRAIGMFPNGTLVELSNGEVGVVTEQNDVRRLRPKIMIILDRSRQPLKTFRTLDLREVPAEPGAAGAVWIHCGLRAGSYGIDPADYFL
jgi:HD-GYP domain-containing protein (c-di-GMP phosphodiesterase class II)